MRNFATACFLSLTLPVTAADLTPMADIHTHYNWSQAEVTSPEQAIKALKENGVVLTIVMSTPSLDALKLRKAGGDWVLPFFSPYTTGRNRNNWYYDMTIVDQARKALETGEFFGIGEVHVISGLGPRRDNPIFQGLIKLAEEFKVPFLIHTETSSYRFLTPICKKYPKVTFIWAHAGGILGPADVRGLLTACPNTYVEMSARDPDHYGTFLTLDGRLPNDWAKLMIDYADRFMTGTDPVWNAHQVNRWYEADIGWQHYQKFNRFHRDWIKQLPKDVQEKIRLKNALKLFGHN